MRDNNQLIDKRIVNRLNWLKLLYFGLISFSISVLYGFVFSPNHVSYTEIKYEKNQKSLSITLEVYTNDLETAILLNNKPDTFVIGIDSLPAPSEQYIQAYITNTMTIIIDGIVIKQPKFISIKSDPKRTIIEFSYTDLPPFKSFSIYSEVFTSIFPEQQNIVVFNHQDIMQKALLTKSQLNHTWIIQE